MYTGVFPCMYVCVRVSDPLGEELQAVVSCPRGVGNQTQVLYKSNSALNH